MIYLKCLQKKQKVQGKIFTIGDLLNYTRYRTEQFKLHIKQREPVHYGRPTIILDSPELYNLRADFSEKYDVALNHPGRL